MNRMTAALLLTLLTAMPVPAAAQTATEDAERLATEGLGRILQALDLLIKTIPQYAAPEVQPNGDIIIRRLHPEEDQPQETDHEPADGTNT